jgi:hypothetical protein
MLRPAPPPRRDVPCPDHMTEEKYAAYLNYLASAPPDVWRDADGTIYPLWVPSGEKEYRHSKDLHLGIKPGDPMYGRYLDDLLPHFDYARKEVPHAAGIDHDAEAR